MPRKITMKDIQHATARFRALRPLLKTVQLAEQQIQALDIAVVAETLEEIDDNERDPDRISPYGIGPWMPILRYLLERELKRR